MHNIIESITIVEAFFHMNRIRKKKPRNDPIEHVLIIYIQLNEIFFLMAQLQ